MKKEKYYVVWAGVSPGIYTSWTDCQLQTKGYEGAKYKSFESREEAEKAFASSPYAYIKRSAPSPAKTIPGADAPLPAAVAENSLAVDAACDHLRRGVDTVCKMAVTGNYQTDHTRCPPEFMTLF